MQKLKEKSRILGPKIVNIFDRQKIEVVGALEIISSTEKEIYIKLASGIMTISGDGLTILKLSPEEEHLIVSGEIEGVSFKSKLSKKSLFGKVFK